MNEPRCPRPNCICTHDGECEYGWINFRYPETTRRQDKQGVWHKTVKWYDAVRPCPTCDPERAVIFEKARTSRELQHLLQSRSVAQRQAAYQEQEFNKTRTL